MRRKRITVIGGIALTMLVVIMLLGSAFVAVLAAPATDINKPIPDPDPSTGGQSHGYLWLLNNQRDLVKDDGTVLWDHTDPKLPPRLAEAIAWQGNDEVKNESKPKTSIGPTSRYDKGADYAYETFKEGLKYDIQFALLKYYNFSSEGRGKLISEAFSDLKEKYRDKTGKVNWDKFVNEGAAFYVNEEKVAEFDQEVKLFINDIEEQYTLTSDIVELDSYSSSDYRKEPADNHSLPEGVIKPSDGLKGGHFIELIKRDENGEVIDVHRLRLECFYQDIIPEETPGEPEDDNPPPPPPPPSETTTVTTQPSTQPTTQPTVTTGPDAKDQNKGLNGSDMSHSPEERYIGSEKPDENVDAHTDLPRFTGGTKSTTTTATATEAAQTPSTAKQQTAQPAQTQPAQTQPAKQQTQQATVPTSPTAPQTEVVTKPAVVETSPPLVTNYQPATAPQDQSNRFVPGGEYVDDGY